MRRKSFLTTKPLFLTPSFLGAQNIGLIRQFSFIAALFFLDMANQASIARRAALKAEAELQNARQQQRALQQHIDEKKKSQLIRQAGGSVKPTDGEVIGIRNLFWNQLATDTEEERLREILRSVKSYRR